MSKKFFGTAQKLGKSILTPIAVLPAAGLLLRLGAPDVLNIPFIFEAGLTLFVNLPILVAIGIAIGFTNGDGVAALSAIVGYFVMEAGLAAIDPSINMGVFGGIIIGIVASQLYNRYKNIKLPDYIAFFGGKRFVPIVTSASAIVVAFLAGFIWPVIQSGIDSLGMWITGAGVLGTFVYGFLNRALIPIGLHHIINAIVWFTFGEYNGATGDLNRFFAGDPTAGQFMTGFFPIMMIALPAACLAMIHEAKPSQKKKVAGILGSAAFTAFLTGVTEPVEFAFLFLAPLLYVFHAVSTGAALAITQFLGIRQGFTSSGGLIDYILSFGIAEKPILNIVVGLGFAVLYYVVFRFAIRRFDIQTPGRFEEDEIDSNKGTVGKVTVGELAKNYLKAFGERKNIKDIEACATRIRLQVEDGSIITDSELKKLGAIGIIRPEKNTLQVVVGTKADILVQEIESLLQSETI